MPCCFPHGLSHLAYAVLRGIVQLSRVEQSHAWPHYRIQERIKRECGKTFVPVPFPPAASDVSKASRMLFSLYLSCWSSWTWKAWCFGPVVHMPMVYKLGLDMSDMYWLVSHTHSVQWYNPSQNCPSHQPPPPLVKELLWVGTPLVSSHAQRLKGQRATLYGHDVSGLVKAKNGCWGTDGMTQESKERSMEDIRQTCSRL